MCDAPLQQVGPRTLLVTSEVALQEGLQLLLSTRGGGANAVVAIHALSHKAFVRQETTTYLCLSSATHDVLIDLLSPARMACAVSLGALIAKNASVVKVVYGDHATRCLQRDFGLQLAGDIVDVLFLATMLELPLLSISDLRGFGAAAGEGVGGGAGCGCGCGYVLHDSTKRPAAQNMLSSFTRDCHSLLDIEAALRRKCCVLKGETRFRHTLAVMSRLRSRPETRGGEGEFIAGAGVFPTSELSTRNQPTLSATQTRTLEALWGWRHKQARQVGLSTKVVASSASLLILAIAAPATTAELLQVGALFPLSKFILLSGSGGGVGGVLACIASALDVGPVPGWLSVSRSIDEDDLEDDEELAAGDFRESSAYSSSRKMEKQPSSPATLPPTAGSPIPYVGTLTQNTEHHHYRERVSLRAASPVQPAEDVYRFAGWSTPVPFDGRSSPFPFSPPPLSGGIAGATAAEKRTTASAASTTAPAHSAGVGSSALVTDEDANDLAFRLVSLPDTYEEIFQISNRNRRRKDRAKTTGAGVSLGSGEASVGSSIESLGSLAGGSAASALNTLVDQGVAPGALAPEAFAGMNFDENIYFSTLLAPSLVGVGGGVGGGNSVTASVTSIASGVSSGGGGGVGGASSDAALDFTLALGWLGSIAVRDQVKMSHLQDFAAHTDGDSTGGEGGDRGADDKNKDKDKDKDKQEKKASGAAGGKGGRRNKG